MLSYISVYEIDLISLNWVSFLLQIRFHQKAKENPKFGYHSTNTTMPHLINNLPNFGIFLPQALTQKLFDSNPCPGTSPNFGNYRRISFGSYPIRLYNLSLHFGGKFRQRRARYRRGPAIRYPNQIAVNRRTRPVFGKLAFRLCRGGG